MRIPRIPTKPRLVALAVTVATALGAGGLALATAGPAAAAGSAFPAHYAAPYLQIASSDAGDMAADMAATGLKYYTLAFLTPQSGCTPEWEDGGNSVGAFTSQVSAIQAAGGNVIISFGGESGGRTSRSSPPPTRTW
jgi:chitinase